MPRLDMAAAIVTFFAPKCGKRGGFESPPKDEEIVDKDSSCSSDTKLPTTIESNHHKLKYTLTHGVRRDTTGLTISEIHKATENFSEENIIGQGSTGTVYKGMLEDGSVVAIKRAKKNVNDHIISDFKNEMKTLSKVEHLNLVRFRGFLEKEDEQILVVEYVGNGTLRDHLDGLRGEGLGIAERLEVAIDVAHAVTYLHMYTDHAIIHRDIKATNILLTEKLRAKVADFGFARLAEQDPRSSMNVSTHIKGTFGYLDPVYLRTYHLTEKSDVYSYGVVLVELVTGRHPIETHRDPDDRNTTKWVRDWPFVVAAGPRVFYSSPPGLGFFDFVLADERSKFEQAIRKMKEGSTAEAMDPRVRRSAATVAAAERMLGLAAECVSASRSSRPSMKRCAEELWEIRRDYWTMRRRSSVLTATRGAKAAVGRGDDLPILGRRGGSHVEGREPRRA